MSHTQPRYEISDVTVVSPLLQCLDQLQALCTSLQLAFLRLEGSTPTCVCMRFMEILRVPQRSASRLWTASTTGTARKPCSCLAPRPAAWGSTLWAPRASCSSTLTGIRPTTCKPWHACGATGSGAPSSSIVCSRPFVDEQARCVSHSPAGHNRGAHLPAAGGEAGPELGRAREVWRQLGGVQRGRSQGIHVCLMHGHDQFPEPVLARLRRGEQHPRAAQVPQMQGGTSLECVARLIFCRRRTRYGSCSRFVAA